MRKRLVKWFCIATIFVAFASGRLMGDYVIPFKLVVGASAAVVAVQAFRAAPLCWAAAFLAIVFLFNPAIPVFPLARLSRPL